MIKLINFIARDRQEYWPNLILSISFLERCSYAMLYCRVAAAANYLAQKQISHIIHKTP